MVDGRPTLCFNARVPHPFASFAKGWVFPSPQTRRRGEALQAKSVESHPCARSAQGWGTRLSISGRSYFAEIRLAARSTAFSAAWGNWTGTKYILGDKDNPRPTRQSRGVDGAWRRLRRRRPGTAFAAPAMRDSPCYSRTRRIGVVAQFVS